jgi:hypothetical protein
MGASFDWFRKKLRAAKTFGQKRVEDKKNGQMKERKHRSSKQEACAHRIARCAPAPVADGGWPPMFDSYKRKRLI